MRGRLRRHRPARRILAWSRWSFVQVSRGQTYAGFVDPHKQSLLDRLDALADAIGRETADAVVLEVKAFGPVRDAALSQEVFELSRDHVRAFVSAARRGRPPSAEELEIVRQRAAQRAREMVPLTAMLQAYLVGHRTLLHAITREAGTGAASRGAVLDVLYVLADRLPTICSIMVDTYVQTERGELADLEADRRELIETLLESRIAVRSELVRRAAVLGLEPDHSHVVALAGVVSDPEMEVPPSSVRRWVAEAIARASAGPRRAFVVIRGAEIVAILDGPGSAARMVLERAAESLSRTSGVLLTAGIGTPFTGVAGVRASYDEARRALRHSTPQKRFVVGPGDVLLFDELTASVDQSVSELVPSQTRKALSQPALHATLEAFVSANQNVVDAANALGIHPNSLRYRLSRIAQLTGRDPRTLADLVELLTALRLLERERLT